MNAPYHPLNVIAKASSKELHHEITGIEFFELSCRLATSCLKWISLETCNMRALLTVSQSCLGRAVNARFQ